jgi:hypothetical protein
MSIRNMFRILRELLSEIFNEVKNPDPWNKVLRKINKRTPVSRKYVVLFVVNMNWILNILLILEIPQIQNVIG